MDNSSWLTLCQISVVLGSLVSVIAGGGAVYFSKKTSEVSSEKLNSRIAELSADSQQLQKTLEPFVEMATQKYHGLAQSQALEKLRMDFETINQAVKRVSRGVSNFYDFKGVKRSTSPGVHNSTVGKEFGVFQKIVKAEKEKDYSALIAICRAQISETPDWLTPYLFLGMALANTGKTTEAQRALKHVVENSGGDPAYKDAESFLRKLEGQ